MPAIALDAERLAQLRVFTEAEVRQITTDVIDAIASQLERLQVALQTQDLHDAADAAHRGRNESLLVGARELCAAFTSLERAARAGDMKEAAASAAAAHTVWPPTREAIADLFAVSGETAA